MIYSIYIKTDADSAEENPVFSVFHTTVTREVCPSLRYPKLVVQVSDA